MGIIVGEIPQYCHIMHLMLTKWHQLYKMMQTINLAQLATCLFPFISATTWLAYCTPILCAKKIAYPVNKTTLIHVAFLRNFFIAVKESVKVSKTHNQFSALCPGGLISNIYTYLNEKVLGDPLPVVE